MVQRSRLPGRVLDAVVVAVLSLRRQFRDRIPVPGGQRHHRAASQVRPRPACGGHQPRRGAHADRPDRARRGGSRGAGSLRWCRQSVADPRPLHAHHPDRHHREGPRPGHLVLPADAAVPPFRGWLGAGAGLPVDAGDRRALRLARGHHRPQPEPAGDRPPLGHARDLCAGARCVDVAGPLRPPVCPQQPDRVGRGLHGRQCPPPVVHVPGGRGDRAGRSPDRKHLAPAPVAAGDGGWDLGRSAARRPALSICLAVLPGHSERALLRDSIHRA